MSNQLLASPTMLSLPLPLPLPLPLLPVLIPLLLIHVLCVFPTLITAIQLTFCTGFSNTQCESGSPFCETLDISFPFCYHPQDSNTSYMLQGYNNNQYIFDIHPGSQYCEPHAVIERLMFAGTYACLAQGNVVALISNGAQRANVPKYTDKQQNAPSLAIMCKYVDSLCASSNPISCSQVNQDTCIQYQGSSVSMRASVFLEDYLSYEVFYTTKDCTGPSLIFSSDYRGGSSCTDELAPYGSFGLAYNPPIGYISYAKDDMSCNPQAQGYQSIRVGLGCLSTAGNTSIMVNDIKRETISIEIFPQSSNCDSDTISLSASVKKLQVDNTPAYICARTSGQAYLISDDMEIIIPVTTMEGFADFYKLLSTDCKGVAYYQSVLSNTGNPCEENLQGSSGKLLDGTEDYLDMDVFLGDAACQGGAAAGFATNAGLFCFPTGGGSYMLIARPNNQSLDLVDIVELSPSPSVSMNANISPSQTISQPTVTASASPIIGSGGPTPTASPSSNALSSLSPSPSTEASISALPSGDDPCFPATARVQMQDGSFRAMHELELGDVVRVAENKYSEIYFFGHRDPQIMHPGFVEVTLESGAVITASKGHFVWSNNGWMDIYKVQLGDIMLSMPVEQEAREFQVVAIERNIVKQGLYNPHTMEGSIVVDGILASSYTKVISPELAHWLLAPQRLVFILTKFSLYGHLLDLGTPKVLFVLLRHLRSVY